MKSGFLFSKLLFIAFFWSSLVVIPKDSWAMFPYNNPKLQKTDIDNSIQDALLRTDQILGQYEERNRAEEQKQKNEVDDIINQHPIYQQVLTAIEADGPCFRREFPSKYPLPEEGLFHLFYLCSKNDPKREDRIKLLFEAAQDLNNLSFYRTIYTKMSNFYGGSAPQSELELCALLLEKAPIDEEINKSKKENFKKIVWNLYYQYEAKKNDDKNINALLDAIARYYVIDEKEAQKFLSFLLKILNQYKINMTEDFLSVLALQKRLNFDSFIEIAQEIINKKSDKVVKIYFQTPVLKNTFEGTILGWPEILESMIMSLSQYSEDKKSNGFSENYHFEQSLEFILLNHQSVDKKDILFILENSRTILQLNPNLAKYISVLLDFPDIEIQEKAYNEILFYLEYQINNNINKYWVVDFFDYLLDKNYDYLKTKTLCCVQFFTIFKEAGASVFLQKIWLFLIDQFEKTNEKIYQDIVCQQIQDYWNMSLDKTNLDWKNFNSQIIEMALNMQTTSLNKIHAFIEDSKRTGYNHFFNPELFQKLNDLMIWDESQPLKLRIESFNDLITRLKNSEDILALNMRADEKINNDVFREYFKNIFIILNPETTIFDKYAAKRALIHMREIYDDITNVPLRLSDLYNVNYHRFFQKEKRPAHFKIDKTFDSPKIDSDSGFIFGFADDEMKSVALCESHVFYACDVSEGYAVWSYPFDVMCETNKKYHLLYSVAKDVVYLTYNNKVIVLNKANGAVLKDFEFADKNPIIFIASNPADILYVVQKNAANEEILTGLKMPEMSEIFHQKISPKKGKSIFGIAGNYFCATAFASDQLSFIGPQGIETILDTHLYKGNWVAQENILYFERKISKQRTQLVRYNLLENKEEWVFDLPSSISQKSLKLSAKGTELFFLTENGQLMALSASLDLPSKQRIIWWENIKSQSSRFTVDHILPDLSGGVIHGLEEGMGRFAQYDARTGEKLLEYEAGNGCFVGISKSGRVYIQ
ncbi:MAG: hypothetical protein Q8S31_01760 [Alphaproteobacteria bacterium]|nr:hypothetical protein [Alphaproteobacteria bacterium]